MPVELLHYLLLALLATPDAYVHQNQNLKNFRHRNLGAARVPAAACMIGDGKDSQGRATTLERGWALDRLLFFLDCGTPHHIIDSQILRLGPSFCGGRDKTRVEVPVAVGMTTAAVFIHLSISLSRERCHKLLLPF
jgi:hypothetical protein